MGLDQLEAELLSSWQGSAGGDGTVAHAAWASSNDLEKLASKSDEDIRRVVTGVVDLNHQTPKERLWMEFYITCPIMNERHFDKYRMTVQYQDFEVTFYERPMGGDHLTQNELSARYRTIPERPCGMPRDVARIITEARGWRGSDRAASGQKLVDKHWMEMLESQYHYYEGELKRLKEAEKRGDITNAEYKRAREFIRGALGTAYLTNFRICMNLGAFKHIIDQRLEPVAQVEDRVIAFRMLKEVIRHRIAPVTIGELLKVTKWTEWMDEVSAVLVSESGLKPEDNLWMAILARENELKSKSEDDVRVYLHDFPKQLVDLYLATSWRYRER